MEEREREREREREVGRRWERELDHVCRFCNMQQPSCNYIPPGVSRLQQSGVFFFCQLRLIFSKHARLGAGGREGGRGWGTEPTISEDVQVRAETKASVKKYNNNNKKRETCEL